MSKRKFYIYIRILYILYKTTTTHTTIDLCTKNTRNIEEEQSVAQRVKLGLYKRHDSQYTDEESFEW